MFLHNFSVVIRLSHYFQDKLCFVFIQIRTFSCTFLVFCGFFHYFFSFLGSLTIFSRFHAFSFPNKYKYTLKSIILSLTFDQYSLFSSFVYECLETNTITSFFFIKNNIFSHRVRKNRVCSFVKEFICSRKNYK